MSMTFLRNSSLLIGLILLASSRPAFPQEATPAEAQQKDIIVYPGQGTTVNGKPVYISARLTSGDQVQTTIAISKLTVGSVEMELDPNTSVTISVPLTLTCGRVSVRSGSIVISNHEVSAGQFAETLRPCNGPLPDSPEALQSEQDLRSTSRRLKPTEGAMPTAAGKRTDFQMADWSYWSVNGAMLSSSIVAAQLTQDCLHSGKCDFVPNAFHSRAAMYGAGLPAATGVAYLGYYLKKKNYRWWFVPAALVTAGNVIVAAHAARYSR
ncbi:MAG: hypothetical protein WB780_07930 [Candidatus Acidiferrales bacterium]